jgi:hypothetical protein
VFPTKDAVFGIGPLIAAPIASNRSLGTGKWQAGAAGVVVVPKDWEHSHCSQPISIPSRAMIPGSSWLWQVPALSETFHGCANGSICLRNFTWLGVRAAGFALYLL